MSHASKLIKEDILQYLEQHENKDMLRFITCGSVDDGKSTLIGRLLHDSKLIYEDQLAALVKDSKRHGTTGDQPDLALLVDGLQAEREQGITIDVAYRYFSTERRKFIIADTPGHEQYTRNMATGASTCDLAIILLDARKSVESQTRRHSFIVSSLGIKQIIVAINKMDLVEYSQARYKKVQQDYLKMAGILNIPNIRFVPISALKGDNVVHRSKNTPWFRGRSLIEYLETVEVIPTNHQQAFRFPVQYVNRPNSEFRGYAGTISSGQISVGDTIRVLPSGKISSVRSIVTFDGNLDTATTPLAVTLTLNDEIDISRGDVIVDKNALAHCSKYFRARIVWMHESPLLPYQTYYIKIGTKTVKTEISKIHYRFDINSLDEQPAEMLTLNEIGVVDFELAEVVVFDKFETNKFTGAFIVIDTVTNSTVGAGMIHQPLSEPDEKTLGASDFEKRLNSYVRKHFPHWGAKAID
ncbi:sulfate adenylyltransferase subunit CysN [Pseudidiomarina sp. GXY010]|uniref:Sulfate adenylyltransferase subunit 1 n=1 Tax=Pseudidiomarina fusca TaxID=2965078 RepID=A0ABU3KXU9_9GAMM|nr:sulfate adenylyltransferase subunit CysN [Pseudidiomarina sp. GXY010]MDT7526329.1 sulfate adenylyltransferase subunit CysN [Pseudidiomarina sp. GXY010]